MAREFWESIGLGDTETQRKRRELVRSYMYLGHSDIITVIALSDQQLIPLDLAVEEKIKVVQRDQKFIRAEDARRFRKMQKEGSELALHEYIARQEFLFHKAAEDGNWALARDLSKDIAKSYGVTTEEPVKVETDLLSQMRAAFAKNMQRINRNTPPPELADRQPPTIDVTPKVANGAGKE